MRVYCRGTGQGSLLFVDETPPPQKRGRKPGRTRTYEEQVAYDRARSKRAYERQKTGLATSVYGPLCRHCNQKKPNRPRGLCYHCYYTPGVLEQYPSKSKFATPAKREQ